MKLTRSLLATALIFSLGFLSFLTVAVQPVSGQTSRVALQRGYRTGYSDGYMSGYRDSIDNLGKEASRHKEYVDADRAFSKDYGTLEDYRDGYRQGFESGYETGFSRTAFESTVPSTLERRGVRDIAVTTRFETPAPPAAIVPETVESSMPVAATIEEPVTESEPEQAAMTEVQTNLPAVPATSQPLVQATAIMRQASYINDDEAIIIIPQDTEIILELEAPLSTETNRDGDSFTATIVSPVEIAGAKIEGRIDRIQKPGRIKRRSQMELSFDRIVLNERRWSNFGAILTEVMPVKGDNIKLVDNEGTAIGKSTYKDDGIKIGASTGAGLGIGAIAGGPVGAAVGAGVGAAFGVGAAVVDRGKHIRLNKNQQLKIKASYETKIR
jgi:hypothetical protein